MSAITPEAQLDDIRKRVREEVEHRAQRMSLPGHREELDNITVDDFDAEAIELLRDMFPEFF